MLGFAIGMMCLVVAAAFLCLAAAEWGALRRAENFPGEAEGQVCGLVHHCVPARPDRYAQEGEVPQNAFRTWARSTIHGNNGAIGFLQGLTPWTYYPCVRFSAAEGEKIWIPSLGNKAGVWAIGQRVRVRYDPARPAEYLLEEDPAPARSIGGDLIWAAVFAAIGIVLLAICRF